jgi:alkylhydroperoxidase/carboxymuconolactone decarboxylase family protein YurZ
MSHHDVPKHYTSLKERFPEVVARAESLGAAAREHGPIDTRTGHLIQLAAAAAIGSEGSVHSHARRALAAGATAEEMYHAVILLVSTLGFPRVAAAVSWVDDVIGD